MNHQKLFEKEIFRGKQKSLKKVSQRHWAKVEKLMLECFELQKRQVKIDSEIKKLLKGKME